MPSPTAADTDLLLIPAKIVALLKASTDLAPLTPRTGLDEAVDGAGISRSMIVDMNDGDIVKLVQTAVNRTALAVYVRITGAGGKTVVGLLRPFYHAVKIEITIHEVVVENMGAQGTGLPAWLVADRIVAELNQRKLDGLTDAYEIIPDENDTIKDVSSLEDITEKGRKVLQLNFTTKTGSVPRTE